MRDTRIGVALLGFGTVGGGVYQLLQQEFASQIQVKHGTTFEVRKILVRSLKKRRRNVAPRKLFTTDFRDILSDDSVDVVVEVMGGIYPTRKYILDALRAGKDVITANKALMGQHCENLVDAAKKYGRYLGFSAAITGCHHFCSSILSSILVRSLAGVFNGTANYILTRMQEGLSLEQALEEAQKEGYAELNPSSDVDGHDTVNKLVIVSRLAFGVSLKPKDIDVDGIRQITQEDMDNAHKLDYTIKLLGVARLHEDDKIEAWVCPCLIPKKHPLASVIGVQNGIQVYDEFRDVHGMNAFGAGARPTAMAIFNDLISLSQQEPIAWPSSRPKKLKRIKFENTLGKYYVRMTADNKPGVLAKITKILGRHGINILSVVQRDENPNSKVVPLVVICGPTQHKHLKRALGSIGSLGSIRSKPFFLRVEDALTPQLITA